MIDYDRIEAIPEIDLLMDIADRLPEQPVIVEVGTYLGGTTVRLAKRRADSLITTIDCCNHGNNWIPPFNDYVQKYLVEQVLHEPVDKKHLINNIQRFPNINFIDGYSPDCILNWDRGIDLYFEDGNHKNPYLTNNIVFWSKFVKVGGYLAVHDYCMENVTDTVTEVNKLIKQGWVKIDQDRSLVILTKLES